MNWQTEDRHLYVREPYGNLAARAYPDEWIKHVMLNSTQQPFGPCYKYRNGAGGITH